VQVTSLTLSSDTGRDRLQAEIEDAAIAGDGTDATRFTVRVVDVHGNQRRSSDDSATLSLSLDGPAMLVGLSPFPIGAYGGVAGGFIRSAPGATGTVTLTATHSHPALATTTATLQVVGGSPSARAQGSGGPRALTSQAAVGSTSSSAPPAGPPARTANTSSPAAVRAVKRIASSAIRAVLSLRR
jgi:hypothetical protein